MISALADDIARYSASVEDLNTVVCFLHFHEIRESPRNIHQPVVDRRKSGQPPQSASAYADRRKEVSEGYKRLSKSASNIVEYAQSSSNVGFVSIAHKLANHMNCMRNIKSSHS